MGSITVRVALPAHLRRLSGVAGPVVEVDVPADVDPVTLGSVLTALEHRYPPLRGTIRDHPGPGSVEPGPLRPFMRFFALEEDLTPAGQSAALPAEVLSGKEVLRIIGAIAGG